MSVVEPPDPACARRMRAARQKAEGLGAMLRQHCRFEFANGTVVKQRRINDTSYLATFTVTRPDGVERTFHHGLAEYMVAREFAVAEVVKEPLEGEDHPLIAGR